MNSSYFFCVSEFRSKRDESSLMKKFATDGLRLRLETGMKMGEILKCLDAIPMVYHEEISQAKTHTEISIADDDVERIKYIGGCIIRKFFAKQTLEASQKSFLLKCIDTGIVPSSLISIVGSFANILLMCEKSFREYRSRQAHSLISLKHCFEKPELNVCLGEIAGDCHYLEPYRLLMKKILLLFLKIGCHRYPACLLEDHKQSKSRKSLRKNLKSQIL